MVLNTQLKNRVQQSEIRLLADSITETHLLRLAGFADVIKRFIDIQLRDKINWNKTFALVILTINGGLMTPSELGRHMLRSKENITKLVDALVQEELVKRYRRGKDRRSVQIKLTADGYYQMKKIIKDVEREEKLVSSILNHVESEQLKKISLKLIGKLVSEIRNSD
jgi:DNA-binding MarR family transcriptional regulator